MIFRLIGALVLCLGASGLGFSAAGSVRANVKTLQQLKLALEMMRCEISYTLTPASRICRIIQNSSRGDVKTLFEQLEAIYTSGVAKDGMWAEGLVHRTLHNVPAEVADAITELLCGFGQFGANEQLRLIDLNAAKVDAALARMEAEKKQRCRCYETLGICTGLAIAVLVL